ncbi:zincin-like metallopeptidase toxin domain-containing protein [Chryseobacterium sp.]|jgi:hypothetical protein|uniref:zincin-like metallopeptidase toxin domain-containing protein n=1 Tax=Chryseobacterium sp. TaxID=1871047 RepID=UPI00283CF3FB|nr:zincin-like metallopeptidase toxin domain-containing protein [Chryseobacterium sp.]MDR3024205.1 hypothetical protein [Chryseobacterium sp.]
MSLEILNNPLLRSITDFANNPDSSRTIFPNQESPPELKQKTSRQIANTYYGGKPLVDGNGFQIYSDDPVFGGNIEEVVVYKSRFSKTIAGIDVVLFASKNGAFLLQRYMEALPNSNELILFLEIDDRYNHNTVMRAVAGAGLTNKKDMPFADILSFTRKHEVTVTPKSLKNLIEKGLYRNKIDFISWFLGLKDKSIGEIFSFFKQEALEAASTFFTEGIAENIIKLRISENGWNPNPKEGEYNPAFIPEVFYKEIKDFYEHKASQNPYENLAGQKKLNSRIVKSLFESINEAKDDFNSLLKNTETFFPSFIYKRISKSLAFFFNQVDKLEKFIADPLTGMQHIVYKNYQIGNAFLCGIYNSLVDIIAGIFSIIGFIFKAVAAMDKVNDRKVEYGEMFLELMEDLLEGILTFDYVEFFKQCISFQLETIVRLVKWIEEKIPQITLEKAAYYYGYIIGIIIDIIVETLLTSGTAAVAKLAKSVESFILNPLEKITKAITTVENALNRIIEFIRMILREFKKGSKEIFSKLEKILNEVFGFGEEVADHGLSPKQKKAKDKQRRIQEKIERKNKKYSPDNIKGDGVYDGKILSERDIEDWAKLLKKKFGTSLKKVDEFNDPNVLAQFDPNTNTILYRENVTEYLMAHEHYHAEEMHIIGFDAYVKDATIGSPQFPDEYTAANLVRVYKREKYVHDKIIKNKKKFNLNDNELRHNFYNLDFYQYHLEKRNITIPN